MCLESLVFHVFDHANVRRMEIFPTLNLHFLRPFKVGLVKRTTLETANRNLRFVCKHNGTYGKHMSALRELGTPIAELLVFDAEPCDQY
jgi:hypothetical protein